MAKKAPVNDPAFSPVKSGLLHSVLRQRVNGEALPIAHDTGDTPIRVAHRQHAGDRVHEPVVAEAGQSRDRLTREKRVLLSRGEEIAVNELVLRISACGSASPTLSHLLRACVLLLQHSKCELIDRLRGATDLSRPANDNPPALATFQLRLAREVAAAIRLAPPL